MKLVTLTDREVAQAFFLGHRRGAPKAGYASTKLWSPDATEAVAQHVWGVMGEIAVARVSGGSIDLSISPMGDEGAGDVLLPSGKTIEVKTRGRWGWDWATNGSSLDEVKADYIALVWPEPGPKGESKLLKRVRLACGVSGKMPSECADYVGPAMMTVVGWQTRSALDAIVQRQDFGYGSRAVIPYQRMIQNWPKDFS